MAVLTDSPTPRKYWGKVKDREFVQLQLSQIWRQLKLVSSDGKKYATDCTNTRCMLRIIQSIPSKKAEPFKRWLAQVGYERIQEASDPELATKRTIEMYKAKGYSDEWIKHRMRSIVARNELTKEWRERGVDEKDEFAILTSETLKNQRFLACQKFKKLVVCQS